MGILYRLGNKSDFLKDIVNVLTETGVFDKQSFVFYET